MQAWLAQHGIRLERAAEASVPVYRGGADYRWVTHRPGQFPHACGTPYRSLREIDDHWAFILVRYYWHRQTWILACAALAEADAGMPDQLSRWLAGEGTAGVPCALVRAFAWATGESVDASPGAPVFLELPADWQAIALAIFKRQEGLPRTYEEFLLRALLAEEIKRASRRHLNSLPVAPVGPVLQRRL